MVMGEDVERLSNGPRSRESVVGLPSRARSARTVTGAPPIQRTGVAFTLRRVCPASI
jgi:hypothetical protein